MSLLFLLPIHPCPTQYSWCTTKKIRQLPIPESISGLYHEAAEHLRSSHGVTSITPVSLRQAVALLNLPPRRLVTQGLAPHWSLKAQQSPPLSQQQTEAATALPEEDNNADLMSEHEYVSDTESEDGDDLDDNTVVVEEVEYDSTPSAVTLAVPAAGDLSIGYDQQQEEESTTKASNFAIDAAPSAAQSSPSETLDRGDTQVEQASSPSSESVISGDFTHAAAASNSTIATFTETSPLHAALVAGGVSIHPHETDALIHALGVDPPRLVHLGLVKQEIAHAVPTTATDICARPRRSVSRPAGARKPKTIRVPVRLAGSKRRGARSSSSANTNDIFANLIRKSGKLVGEGVVVPWPQLAVSTTAPSQRLRVQTIRGMGSASSRKGMQVRAFSRHGARDNGPASRRQRIVSNPNAGV